MKISATGLLIMLAVLIAGCSRSQYRKRADWDAYSAIYQKSCDKPWEPPARYSVYPEPGSRFYDESCEDCPTLPIPAPELYAYQVPEFLKPGTDATTEEDSTPSLGDEEGPLISPIPPEAWENIPIECRRRMFDIASLRQEASLTDQRYQSAVGALERSNAPLLTLPEIIELALLNSRQYQTQKETLYQVALALSFERFAYQFKPFSRGNGTDFNYGNNQFNGVQNSTLGIPSTLGFDKLLVTGGDFLARFANNVLLTFNGADGFATDVSTDMLFELTQPLLQRDIVFEGLTQSERNVVYAARDFARFRKQFFADFAATYYARLRAFRQIEIESQNYFSLVRAFNQAEAEYRAELVSRIEVDQVEQNLLSGRRNLISVCNNLEQQLDSLKLEIGLPTETPINIDLTELNQLTQRDKLSVSGNLVQRARRRISAGLAEPDSLELLSAGVVLVDRILAATQIQNELGIEARDTAELELQRARMLIETSRLTARVISEGLDSEINSDSPSLPTIFQRSLALSNNLLEVSDRQIQLASLSNAPEAQINSLQQRRVVAMDQTAALEVEFQQIIRDEQLERLPELVRLAAELRTAVEQLVREIDAVNGIAVEEQRPDETQQQTIQLIRDILVESDAVSDNLGGGLEPVDIDVDSAMLTSLVLRFELMNQRGRLADVWRDIKLRGDALRAILDVKVSHSLSTSAVGNARPSVDPHSDRSQTDVSLLFDAPLNRRGERNAYRNALINYQRGRRDLMEAEDQIKFGVRNTLRSLALDKEQYLISVAGAALAYERVVSTSLEFRLGTGGVSARDFLEAQVAYIDALSDVASRHIDYIVDRTQLFLDLELLTVNESGFWDVLYDEKYQPQSYFDMPTWSLPAYGELPAVKYSKEIQGMLNVPTGTPAIFKDSSEKATTRMPASPDQNDASRSESAGEFLIRE